MEHQSSKHALSDFPKSYWLTHPVPSFPQLTENIETEVGVIGGGIFGILTAYLLAKAGVKVALIEAREFLHGVTGHTTAKISAQHGLIYDDLMRTFGEADARLYFEANMEGRDLIEGMAADLAIDCDLETKEAVVFASSEKSVKKVEVEARAYEKLGIDGVLAYGRLDDLPFPVEASLTMRGQAQFHPVKFLAPLLKEIEKLGGRVYEETRAVQLSKDHTMVTMETGAQLTCKQVVVATHYPFNDFDGL
ncbi:MAG TPA: FAD-binding oxidoreductase, partial [Atopostipes sp.]|nr:FAD-binding oxidoreductase [Atopostipes sp.]